MSSLKAKRKKDLEFLLKLKVNNIYEHCCSVEKSTTLSSTLQKKNSTEGLNGTIFGEQKIKASLSNYLVFFYVFIYFMMTLYLPF